MNNETILLLLWLCLTITYPMMKKGIQEMALDLAYLIITPIGLIYRLCKNIQQFIARTWKKSS